MFAQKAMTKAEKDASNVIKYSNSIIDLANYHRQTLDSYDSLLEQVGNNHDRVSRNPNAQPTATQCSRLAQKSSKEDQYLTVAKSTPVFAEKSVMEVSVKKALDDLALINVECEKVSNYFTNKEYKTDKGSEKYTTLVLGLSDAIEAARESWQTAARSAVDAGDKAEMILLKGSPIASFVIPMKNELGIMKSIMYDLSSDKPDLAAISTKSAELRTSLEENKDITKKDVTKLKDAYYRDPYAGFYRSATSFVDGLDTIVERLEAKDTKGLNSWYTSLQTNYNNAIDKYNSFVSQ